MEKEEKVVCRHQMMSKRMNCKKVHPHNVVVSLFHKVCGKSLFINCFMRAKVLIICESAGLVLIKPALSSFMRIKSALSR